MARSPRRARAWTRPASPSPEPQRRRAFVALPSGLGFGFFVQPGWSMTRAIAIATFAPSLSPPPGNPACSPWVLDGAPEDGDGFEAVPLPLPLPLRRDQPRP